MTLKTEADNRRLHARELSFGTSKFFRDVFTVLEIKLLFVLRGWYLWVMRPLVFPLGIFYWLTIVTPDDPEVVRRVLTGAIIFGFSLAATNMLSQQLIQDRFLGRLKLIITMPVSKVAYGMGVMVFATIMSAPTVVLLLAFAPLLSVEFDLTWTFFPFIVPVLFTMGGLTFLIASYAPSMEVGSILSNLFGVVLVVISPVFFSMDEAPAAIQWLGWISPMRYAADGVMKSLSGQTDVWVEFSILVVFASISMGLGLWKLKWRDH